MGSLNLLNLLFVGRQWADEALQLQREWRVLRDQMMLVRGFLREGWRTLSDWQVQQLLLIEEEMWTLAEQLEVTANRLNASIPAKSSSEGGIHLVQKRGRDASLKGKCLLMK